MAAQIFRAAHLLRDLEFEDFRVLTGIELGMRRFEVVPVEQISFYARIDRTQTQYRLDHLHKMGVLQRISDQGYLGYQLISESYDLLALHALVEKNIISAVGNLLGQGKESDVYFAQTNEGTEVILKIHRVGRNSFRQVKKSRSYVKDRKHISWLYIDRLSAEREYDALVRLAKYDFPSPRPIGQNRHMVVMSKFDGESFMNIGDLDDPNSLLDQLIQNIEFLFVTAGIIHGDLSEYNIILTPDGKLNIIDWPQWESFDHPNAYSLLLRDLTNVAVFFEKRFNCIIDPESLTNNFIKLRAKNNIK